MLLTVIITIIYFIFILFDLIPLIKSKQKKTIWIYICILSLAYITQVLYIMDIKIPNINNLIFDIFKNYPLEKLL